MAKTGRTVEQARPDVHRAGVGLSPAGASTAAGWSDGLDHVDPAKMPAKVQSDIWGDLFTALRRKRTAPRTSAGRR